MAPLSPTPRSSVGRLLGSSITAASLALVLTACGDDSVTDTPSLILPSPATLSAAAGNQQLGFPDAVLADSLRVRALDASGRPRAGVLVGWSVTSGGGTLEPAESVTDAAGYAATAWRLGTDTLQSATVRVLGGESTATFTARARGYTFSCAPESIVIPSGGLHALGCGASAVGGYAGTVHLSGAGARVSFAPDSIVFGDGSTDGGTTVMIDAAGLAPGDHTVELRATSGAKTVVAPLAVRVQ